MCEREAGRERLGERKRERKARGERVCEREAGRERLRERGREKGWEKESV